MGTGAVVETALVGERWMVSGLRSDWVSKWACVAYR